MNGNPPEATPRAEDESGRTLPTSAADAAPQLAETESGIPASSAPPEAPLRRRIQIGSRREPHPTATAGAVPEEPLTTAPEVPSPPPRTPVRPPSVREPLSPDLEQALAAALADTSLDEMLVGGPSESAFRVLEPESRHRATLVRIHGDNVFFSLGGRHEGVVSLRQFPQPPALGSQWDVIVKNYHADDGLYELVIPGASAHVEDWSDLVEGAVVEARITGANTGGLECKVGSIRGFIPSSQIAVFRVEDYAEYLDQKLLCVVTEVNPRRKNLVLSRRAVLEREKEEARQALLSALEVGEVKEGVVRKILDFGAFVDIGGIDGLVHISHMSWDHINHPSEVLQEGQTVPVKVEKIDPQTGKIGLSYRDLLEHPWSHIEEKFQVDAVVTGTVSRIAKFGAFVKLAPGIEGLIHISELSHARIPSVGSVVSEGQPVEIKVLSIDPAAQRIALSMKAVLPAPAAEEELPPADAPLEPTHDRVKERQTPLRGGTDRASGGAQFGLKW